MEKLGWTDARLASELSEDTGKISRLLYGDRKAGRQLASKLLDRLGVPLDAWDQPCPVDSRTHAADSGTLPAAGSKTRAAG